MSERDTQPKGLPPTDPDDPEAWSIRVEPLRGRGYVVYLACGALRYGPDKWGWIKLTLKGAFAKGDRELARYQKKLRSQAERRRKILERMREL